MKKVTMNLTSNKIMTKPELIKYYDYLNENKFRVFDSLHKLKNNRELKLSNLLNGDILFFDVVSQIDNLTLDLNKISEKNNELIKNSDDLNLIKGHLEFYAKRLDDIVLYIEYLNETIDRQKYWKI